MIDLLPGYSFLAAGNHASREGKDIDGIVLHYTAGGNGRKTAHWARGKIGRSWHFLICRDGYTVQQVELNRAAWHAGRSEWNHSNGETYSGANRFTVGIELANHGLLEKSDDDKFHYEINGQMFRYHREPPEPAVLKFEGGREVFGWWEPYPDAQIDSLSDLLSKLSAVGVPINLKGHEEIAMPFGLRKTDPGPVFPWERFGRSVRRTSAQPV